MKKTQFLAALLLTASIIVNGQNWTGTNLEFTSSGTVYTKFQFAEHTWSGSHALLFNAYKSITVNGSLGTPNNTKFANNQGAYGGGAGAIMFYGNGGTMDFLISQGAGATGGGTGIDWGTPKMRIFRNGNVGIGTGTPSYRFHVEGDVGNSPVYSDVTSFIHGSANKIGLVVRSNHSSDWNFGIISAVERNNSKAFAVVNTSLGSSGDGEEVFRIYGNGHIECKRVRVATNIWADYVFHKDYNLTSLSETEKYINKNGHLPGIPTEQEVIEQGVDLAEMNRLLLEKVEELTLHLIEQEKKIAQLSKKSKK